MQKTIQLTILLILLMGCSEEHKQSNKKLNHINTKTIKNKLNIPYSKFIEGYEASNAAMISNSYTKDALLINVYNDAEPRSFKGRKSIYDFFSKSLARAEKENLKLKIVFKVANRQIVGETILDNGYYKLELVGPNEIVKERYGKFSIVLKQEVDGWKFDLDTNASATEKEFEEASSI